MRNLALFGRAVSERKIIQKWWTTYGRTPEHGYKLILLT